MNILIVETKTPLNIVSQMLKDKKEPIARLIVTIIRKKKPEERIEEEKTTQKRNKNV